MPIESSPANTRVPRDVRNYRAVIDSDPDVEDEVRRELHEKDPGNFPSNAPRAQLRSIGGYRVFAAHHHASNNDLPHRLGGGLNFNRPGHLGNNLPKPVPGTNVTYNPPGAGGPITIQVRNDGAIVHTDPTTGNELHDVHEYMHAIFDDILYETRDKLEAINLALEAYADTLTPVDSTTYRNAVLAFDDFLASLQPGAVAPSPYADAFNSVGISPVVTNEGFIVSARVKLNWKNPYHSSSTIKIP